MVARIDRRTDPQTTNTALTESTDTNETTQANEPASTTTGTDPATNSSTTTDGPTATNLSYDPSASADSRTRFSVESGADYRAHQIQTSFQPEPEAEPEPAASGPDEMGIASYNLAGGADAKYRNEYGRTTALTANQVVSGDSDVMVLQEVGVGRTDGSASDKGLDYNEQVLVQSFVQTAAPDLAPLDGEGDEKYENISVTSVDDQGQPVGAYDPNRPNMQYTYTSKDGSTQTVQVNRTTVDENGNPLAWDPNGQRTQYTATRDGQPLDHTMTITKESLSDDGTASVDPATGKPIYSKDDPVKVYSADITQTSDGSSERYTMVYGQAYDKWDNGATAGNSVFMGPNNTLARDENGAILDGQIENHLLSGSESDGRRALGVKMDHEGRDVTVVGVHMTNGSFWGDGEVPGDKRSAEYKELKGFVDDFGGGRAVVAGDFNSKPGDSYGWFNNNDYPDTGLELSDKDDGNGFDYITVSPNLDVGDTDTNEDVGGSDHELIEATVTLP